MNRSFKGVGRRIDTHSKEQIGASDSGEKEKTNDAVFGDISATKVISITENRAREICISKIDTSLVSTATTLEIYLLNDSHSYVETLSLIQVIQIGLSYSLKLLQDISPHEILLHDGTKNSILSKKIESLIVSTEARIIFISRQYFDQDRGAALLKKVLIGKVDADLIAKYTVLAGTYCILRYIENCSGQSYPPHSIRIEFGNNIAGSHRMSIDRRTAINLELIYNARSGSEKEGLFGTINFTKTVVGARLLRTNILRPLTDVITLETRLDLVDIFLSHQKHMRTISSCLSSFPDLDKMINGLVSVPKSVTIRTARIGIDTLICLKQTLKVALSITSALEGLLQSAIPDPEARDSSLLTALISNFHDPTFQVFQQIIDETITESTNFSKSSLEMRHQECFALNSGVSGSLDVARKTFLQTVEDIHQTAEGYSSDLSLPIRVAFNSSRGYHLVLPANVDPFPQGFTQAIQNKRSIVCTTEEILSLSNRADEAIRNALNISHELIQDTLARIRENLETLLSLSDSVALLDMLVSFAELVLSNPLTFCRPLFTNRPDNSDVLVIRTGRHPIMSHHILKNKSFLPTPSSEARTHGDRASGGGREGSFVANDCFMGPLENVIVVTGANGSGKSTFIKQIALIVIMAQLGCYVPARHATIPIRDRVLSRIGTSDDMEHNLSTFFNEMKESAYLLNNLTDRSLVIIDELGRGTSNLEGISIAFAIAEQLILSPAFVLFVTHYRQITTLSDLYSNVKNIHLKATIKMSATQPTSSRSYSLQGRVATGASRNDISSSTSSVDLASTSSASNCEIEYLHSVSSGPCDMKTGYGILMAESCGFPPQVISLSWDLLNIVKNTHPVLISGTHTDPCLIALDKLLQQLHLLRNSVLDNEALRRHLSALRGKYSEQAVEVMLSSLDRLALDRSMTREEHETTLSSSSFHPFTSPQSPILSQEILTQAQLATHLEEPESFVINPSLQSAIRPPSPSLLHLPDSLLNEDERKEEARPATNESLSSSHLSALSFLSSSSSHIQVEEMKDESEDILSAEPIPPQPSQPLLSSSSSQIENTTQRAISTPLSLSLSLDHPLSISSKSMEPSPSPLLSPSPINNIIPKRKRESALESPLSLTPTPPSPSSTSLSTQRSPF